MIAMNPKSASANSPKERMTMKNAPMIALNRVKTLPATMLATERLDRFSGGPSLRSRFAASLLESPPGCRSSFIEALIPERAGVNTPKAERIGLAPYDAEARTQPRLLGDRPPGGRGRRVCPDRGARRLRLGLGGRVLRLRRGQRPRLPRGENRDDQARRRDPPGAGPAAGGGGDGGRNDRRP